MNDLFCPRKRAVIPGHLQKDLYPFIISIHKLNRIPKIPGIKYLWYFR